MPRGIGESAFSAMIFRLCWEKAGPPPRRKDDPNKVVLGRETARTNQNEVEMDRSALEEKVNGARL